MDPDGRRCCHPPSTRDTNRDSALTQRADAVRTSDARTTPETAKVFLGEWTARADGLARPTTVRIALKVVDNHVVAIVASDLMGDNTVDDFTTIEAGLVLHYTGSLWG